MFPEAFRHVRRFIACGAVAIVFAATSPAAASIIHVDDDAPPGGDGTSWLTAFNDLQDALAIAQEGDEIRVAQGMYKPAPPNGPRTATFNLVNGTTLRGGYAGLGASDPDANDPKKFETILSGDLNGDDGPNFTNVADNSLHVLTASADIDASMTLRGLTVTAGYASSYDFPDSNGAGMLCIGQAHPNVVECRFWRNLAKNAGGIHAEGPLRIAQSTFVDNRLFISSTGFGGGAYLGANSEVLECLFQNNNAFHGGGGIAGAPAIVKGCMFIENWGEDGGALYGGGVVLDSIFIDNIASFWGGAARSTGTFINCTFTLNRAEKGGALWGSANAINCLFIGNNTWGPGTGGAVNITDSGSLVNCSIVGNFVAGMFSGSQGGGVYKAGSGVLTVTNCVIWANEDSEGDVESSQLRIAAGSVIINNSCVQGWTGLLGGTGNHGNDPRFIDADGPDDIYGTEDDNPRLLPNSPLIDRGDTSALPPDTFDLDEDGDTSEPIPFDLDWLQRIVGPAVDMGAYEFQGTPCLADITGDGEVNVQDLLMVMDAWGGCKPGQPCNADLTLDAAVSLNDFLLIINSWGACP